MGKKKPLTGRKKTLQLSGARKLESGSPLSGKGIYAQTDPQMSTKSPDSQQDIQEVGEQDEEKEKLADFIKAIHTLGSREDIEPAIDVTSHVDGGEMEIGQSSETSLQSGVGEAPTTFWNQVMDSNSNHPYYWNPVTNEVCWTLPAGGVISYKGTPGGDEKGEPLDYFAYYDEGIVVPDRQGKGRGENKSTTELTKKEGGTEGGKGEGEGGGGDKEKEAEDMNVDTATDDNQQQNPEVANSEKSGGTKRKLESIDEAEDGEFQLMPTTPTTQSSSDGVSPPKKMPRGPLPRGVARGVAEEKPRKQRSSPVISSVKQEQQVLRFQVSSLADELSRKLQFLHVSIDGLSDMQILQVEVKTRLSDWEEGGLATKFLLSKLKEASDSLLNHEKEAAPKGWRFLWDSTTCRYQFQHLSTGEICWEYPSSANATEEEEDEGSESSTHDEQDSAIVQSSSHSSLPPPPPPPPSNSQQPQQQQQQQKPAKPVFQTGPTATTVNTSQAIASSQALLMTSLTLAQTMTSSSPVATVTKKQVKPTTPALPPTVTRALVTPEMKQREKVAAATAKPGEKKSKDVGTPTGAFLEGGEMVPAPMPRAWKYENDAQNRRVKREGSIERREDVKEKDISANDVRRKLSSKRSLTRPTSGSSEVDIFELPPPPPKEDTKKKRLVSTATGNQERSGDIVKEAIQALANQTRGVLDTEPVSPPTNNRDVEWDVTMETEAPPSESPKKQESCSPPAVPGGEESEAKLRERLIERTKRLRGAVTEKTPAIPDTETHTQTEEIEESTGLLYPQPDKTSKQNEGETMPGSQPSNQVANNKETAATGGSSRGSGGLIKTGFTATLISVSFDRIEPETGESENVAVEENLGGGFGRGRKGEGLANKATGGSGGRGDGEKREDSEERDPKRNTVSTTDADEPTLNKTTGATAVEKKEERGREEEGGREKKTITAEEKTEDEEGEISSGSSTPGPASETHTVVTPRCYMDREANRMESSKSRGGYDSNSPPEYPDRYSKSSSSRRRYSQSRSRSRDRYGNSSRSSKRRRGDESDFSDYGEERSYSDKRSSRNTNVYSDFSGSDFSEEDRYSRQRYHDYESDDYRERSSERRSRRSRNEDEKSLSWRHKHRSSRSRSRSKESRDSGKHRRSKDKSGSGKKKKKDKKEKKHKKKDKKDENETPKPPKKVTVGRVGRVSSLRTLTSDTGGASEQGDTPLDKAQAAIAESIDEKQKQERELQEKREEGKRLESKIQQHVQSVGGRSGGSGQQQAQVVGGAYPTSYPAGVTQGGYYSGLYAGYQYPGYVAGQGWGTPGQWSGTEYQQYGQTQQQQSGTGEQQYGNVGTGEQQHGNVGTGEQQHGDVGTGEQQYGNGGTGEQQYGTGEQQYASTDSHQYTGDAGGSGNETQGFGNVEVSESGNVTGAEPHAAASESGQPGDTPSGTRDRKTLEPENEGTGMGEPDIQTEGTNEQDGSVDTGKPVERVDHKLPTEIPAPPPPPPPPSDVAMSSTSSHDNEAVAMPPPTTVSTSNDTQQVPPLPPSQTEGEEGDAVVSKEAPPPAQEEREGGGGGVEGECEEMEIDSGGSSPVEVAPPISLPPDDTAGDHRTTDTGGVVGENSALSRSSEEGIPVSDGCHDDEVGPESSPEPLPPGMEPEMMSPVPLPPRDERADDGGATGNGTETAEEPAPPGMEPDQPPPPHLPPPPPPEVTEVKSDTQTPPLPQSDNTPVPPPAPPVTMDTGVYTLTPSISVPSSGVETTVVATTTKESTKTTEGTAAAVPSSATITTPAPQSTANIQTPPRAPTVSSSTATTPSSSQGYDVATAAAAYAHATKTGQPYQYPQQVAAHQQQQQSYSDYAAYTAYLQQMGQYGGGYVLGPDGQYYQQPNPYGAYYGGYYAAYGYASPTAFPTPSGQVTIASKSTPETDKKEKRP